MNFKWKIVSSVECTLCLGIVEVGNWQIFTNYSINMP